MLLRSKFVVLGCTAAVVAGGVGIAGARVGQAGERRAGEKAIAKTRAVLEDRLVLLEKAQGGVLADRERLSGLDKQLGIMRSVVEAGKSTVTVLGHADLEGAAREATVYFRIAVRRAKASDAVGRVLSQAAGVTRSIRAAGATDVHAELQEVNSSGDCCGQQQFYAYGFVEGTVRLSRIDRVVAAGLQGRASEVQNVSFSFTGAGASALRDARAQAIADSKAAAAEYAAMAGRKLGVILSVTEVSSPDVQNVILQPGSPSNTGYSYRQPERAMLVAVTYALV